MQADPDGHRPAARVFDLEPDAEAVIRELEDLAGPIVERRVRDPVAKAHLGAVGGDIADLPNALPALAVDRMELRREVCRQLIGPALEPEPGVGDPVGERHQREAAGKTRIAAFEQRLARRPQQVLPIVTKRADRAALARFEM